MSAGAGWRQQGYLAIAAQLCSRERVNASGVGRARVDCRLPIAAPRSCVAFGARTMQAARRYLR